MTDLTYLAKKRYTTKAFDPNKKIPQDKIEDLQSLLQFSPSSVNSQPWHFVLASTDEAKPKLPSLPQTMASTRQRSSTLPTW